MKKVFSLILVLALTAGFVPKFEISTVLADESQFEWVVKPEWSSITSYSDGYAIIRDESTVHYQISNYGFVDRYGKVHMLPDGYYPKRFKDGVADVRVDEYDGSDYYGTTTHYVRINKNFEIIDQFGSDYKYWERLEEKTQIQTDGYSIVEGKMQEDDRYSGYYVVDKEGNPIIRLYDPNKENYDKEYAIDEDNNMIFIRGINGMAYLYGSQVMALKFDKDPAVLEDVHFDLGTDFEKYNSDALIAYKYLEIDGESCIKYGAFDLNFNLIIPFEYDMLEYDPISREDKIINAKKGDKWGYIDLNNNVIIDFQFDDASAFSEGRGVVKTGGYCGVIRLKDDGELYSPVKNPVDIASFTKVIINDNEENAYKIGEDIYLPVEILKNYGFDIYISHAKRRIDITRRKIKNSTVNPVLFENKDSYTVYEPEAYVYIDRYIYPSALVEDTVAVDFNSLGKYGKIWENNGIAHIAFNSPYLPNEGITWEWVEYSEDIAYKDSEVIEEETK